MRTRLLPLAALSLLAAVLGACGSDDEPERRGVDSGSPASGLASVDLTTDLGCGFGFARVDDAGTTMLTVYHSADAGRITRTVSLPDAGWEAQVNVGRHLDANWCNDVIDEPVAEVDETWEVVEGTLTFDGRIPPSTWDAQGGGDGPVVAELTGVVVEAPDGERVELGDIALTNSSWGFLAG